MKTLIDKFLSLRCAGDVLESVQPISGDFLRKLSESMAIIEAIRPLTLKNRGKYKIVEACVGAPLTAVIAAHLLPVEMVSARPWRGDFPEALSRVQHFRRHDDFNWTTINGDNTIIVAASANYSIAEGLARNCAANKIPMALIPGRASMKLDNDEERAFADAHGDDFAGIVWRLATVAGEDSRVKELFHVSENNFMVTRGL